MEKDIQQTDLQFKTFTIEQASLLILELLFFLDSLCCKIQLTFLSGTPPFSNATITTMVKRTNVQMIYIRSHFTTILGSN